MDPHARMLAQFRGNFVLDEPDEVDRGAAVGERARVIEHPRAAPQVATDDDRHPHAKRGTARFGAAHGITATGRRSRAPRDRGRWKRWSRLSGGGPRRDDPRAPA